MSQKIALNDVLIIQIVVGYANVQQTAVINRHWKVTAMGGVGDITFQDYATFVDTLAQGPIPDILCNNARYRGIRVRRLYPPNVDQWQDEVGGAAFGTAGAVALPTQTCGLLKLGSLQIGKKNNGRVYTPFPSADMNQLDGIPTTVAMGNLNVVASLFSTPLVVTGTGSSTSTATPVICNADGSVTVDVKTSIAEQAWATQKRRGAFGRFNRPPI